MSWQSSSKTKKLYIRRAVGHHITDYATDGYSVHPEKQTGVVHVEGPYPVHKWYAQVSLDENGIVQRVK